MRIKNDTHPLGHLFHGVGVACGDSSLVIAEDGHLTVGIVVSLDLLGVVTRGLHFFEQLTHGVGSVISTEHLGRQPWHIDRKMLIEGGSLKGG